MMKTSRSNWIVISLIAAFFLIVFFSSRKLSPTYDEPAHFRYGMQILQLNSDRFDDSKMPFSALNALPAWIISKLNPDRELTVEQQINLGRVMTMLFALGLALLVYLWSKNLYGVLPAIAALFLYLFEPNLIAHSSLVTTDIYAAGMITISAYALWRYTQKRDWNHALWLASVVGVSLLAKYTGIYLYPLLAVMLLVHDLPGLALAVRRKNWRNFRATLLQYLLLALLIILVSLVVINIGFLFNQSLTPLGDYEFKSPLFQSLQRRLTFLDRVPVPVPVPYLQGLDWVWFNERTGANTGRIYLLGQLSESGFKGYYLVAFLFKVPLATLLMLLLAGVAFIRKFNWRKFLDDEWFLLAPVLFFTIYYNFFFQAQTGIRYYLVIFPFLLIFASSLLAGWRSFKPLQWAVLISLAVYLVISTISYYPHYIPYFNELVLDRRMAYKILADSNLDWGQARHYLEDYQTEHPDLIPAPESPTAGKLVVGANDLVGITARPETFAWLRENFTPVDTLGYALLVYDISENQVRELKSP